LAALAFSTILDTWCYDGHLGNLFSEPVFTPGKFFELNVVSAISIFYGIHSWHWYLSQGIPVVLACLLPTFLYGWYSIGKDPVLNSRIKSLKYVTVWTVAVYSLLSHKEFRFIYPIVPVMHIIAAYGFSQLPSQWRKWAVLLTMAINISMGVYTTTTHQRGVMDAINWVRTEAQELNRMYPNYDMEVAFLMPCHSTPWQSIIHDRNVNAWFLTCEPPLKMFVD
jgi:phosphatidylinositol glycan class B